MNPATGSRGLTGVGVLVTRPAGQAQQLAEQIRAEGGTPIMFPALDIEGLPAEEIEFALSGLEAVDIAVFISPNAVRFGLAGLARGAGPGFAARYAAVGPGTAAELKKAGVREIIFPESGFDSEALLAQLALADMKGKRVAIFRGNGGREMLGDVLQSHGATVIHINCYLRKQPQGDMRALLPLWRSGELQACVATSAEIIENLFRMAGKAGRSWMCQTPTFVPHARVAAAAFAHGARTLFVAGVGDSAHVRGLVTWFAKLRPDSVDLRAAGQNAVAKNVLAQVAPEQNAAAIQS